MTQAAADFDVATEPARPPGAVRQFAAEVGRTLWTPTRLFVRHWPVLFVLAVAGVGAKEGLLQAAIWVTGVNNYLGLLTFLLAPVAVMVSVVLMLVVVRPSLPAVRELDRSGSALRDLGSVLIPFVAFYLAFDRFEEDYREFSDGVFEKYLGFDAQYTGTAREFKDVSVPFVDDPAANVLPLLAIVAVALALRWALDRWKLTRRYPVLGVPAAYFESIWVIVGGLFVVKQWVDRGEGWAGERKAWHGVLDWWHGLVAAAGPLGRFAHLLDDWLVTAFPSGAFTKVFVVPITGLVAAAVVYNVTVSDVLRPPRIEGRLRWFQDTTHTVTSVVGRRYAPLVQGVRATRRTGIVPIMLFCLSVVVLETISQWLDMAERAIVGPREFQTVQRGVYDSEQAFNDALLFMLLVCVLAAAVEGIARRQGPVVVFDGIARKPGPVAPAAPAAATGGPLPGDADVPGQRTAAAEPDRDGLGAAR